VRITVGETPNFLYYIYGETYSNQRIGVSGQYFNDEINRSGSANLFLGASPDIYEYFFDVFPGNQLGIDVTNSFGDRFHYDLSPPPSVPADILRPRVFNYTALIVEAPSRSQGYYNNIYPRNNPIIGKEQDVLGQAEVPAP